MNKTLPKIFIKAVTVISIILITGLAHSQTIPYHNYNTKDGLAHQGVYSIIQDKNGFMWFGTQDGLSRFDGYTFTNFYSTNGLNGNNFRDIGISKDSTLYISNYKGGINTYKNGKFGNSEFNDFKDTYIFNYLYFNDTSIILKTTGYQVIYNNQITPLFKVPDNQNTVKTRNDLRVYRLFHSSKNELLYINNLGLHRIVKGESERIQISGFNDSAIYSIAEDKNENIWIGTYGKIYQLIDYKVIKTIELKEDIRDKVNSLFVDSAGDVWIYMRNKGLFCLMDNRIINVGQIIQLENHPVLCFYEDNQNNVWFSTMGKGIYCFYNDLIMNYSMKDGLSDNIINSICPLKDEGCLIATYNGLNLFRNGQFERISTIKDGSNIDYTSIIKNSYKDSYMVTLGGRIQESSIIPKTYKDIQLYFLPGLGSYQTDSLNFIWSSADNKLYFSKLSDKEPGDSVFVKGDSVYQNWVLDIAIESDSSMRVGTDKGLVRIGKDGKKVYYNDTVLSGMIQKIMPAGNGLYAIAGHNGVAILKNDDVVRSYTKGVNYDFNNTLGITIDNDRNVWIGTIRALYVIHIDSLLDNHLLSLKKFDESNGLPLNNINTLAFNKASNSVYAGTDAGITVINLNRINDFYTVPQQVQYINLELNDTLYQCNNKIVLNYNQNDFMLHFISFNYKSSNSITYGYSLNDAKNWTETKNNKINFSSLAPGDYKLSMYAKDINGIKSGLSELKFTVLAPFWKTYPFYALISLLFVLLVLFISYKRISYIKKKAKDNIDTQNQISNLKHQALSASMNPHFIFNSLNSIQHYMNVHDKEEANEYLVNFARLIRLNLNLAESTLIPLSTEIERLKLYLQYEQLRYDDKMKYKIQISEEIDTYNLLIPNMILQPFVENSIWHGLLPKEGKGLINIEINREDKNISGSIKEVIIIKISDDGVGLKEADKYRKSKHVSKGVSIIKEKLELLAPDMKGFEFIKIQDRDDGITGTIVTITLIPLQYVYKLKNNDDTVEED